MHELINTSVPNGLIPGSHGFSTVAMTRGMSDMLRTKLEMLSGYSHVYSGHDDQYFIQNPESWNHLILATGEHIFSRVAVAPFDYTGRTNRLAHHVVLSSQEIATFNPVDILKNGLYGILSAPWEGEPRWLESRDVQTFIANVPPVTDCTPILWKEILGAGSERFIAQLATYYANLVTGKGRPICLVRSAQQIGNGAKMLALAKELIALLPPNVRHLATFSTYAPLFPAGVKCDLRVITENDPHLAQIRQHSFCIDWGSSGVLNGALLPEPDPSILNAVMTGVWQYIAPQSLPSRAVSPEKSYAPTSAQQPTNRSTQAINEQRLSRPQSAQQRRRVPAQRPYVQTQLELLPARTFPSWLWWVIGFAVLLIVGLCFYRAPRPANNPEVKPVETVHAEGDTTREVEEPLQSAASESDPQKNGSDLGKENAIDQTQSTESGVEDVAQTTPPPSEKQSDTSAKQENRESTQQVEQPTPSMDAPKEVAPSTEQGAECNVEAKASREVTLSELLKTVDLLKLFDTERRVEEHIKSLKDTPKEGKYFSCQCDDEWVAGTFKMEKKRGKDKVVFAPKTEPSKSKVTVYYINPSAVFVCVFKKEYEMSSGDTRWSLDDLFFGEEGDVAHCIREQGYVIKYEGQNIETGEKKIISSPMVDKAELEALFVQQHETMEIKKPEDCKKECEEELAKAERELKKLPPDKGLSRQQLQDKIKQLKAKIKSYETQSSWGKQKPEVVDKKAKKPLRIKVVVEIEKL